MSCAEEQMMELEALESLFPVEFEKLSSTEFKLSLIPFPDNSEINHISAVLRFSFPQSYPMDATVIFSVERTTGCIATDSSRLEDLNECIISVCEENQGVCCVYQIAERVQEWLRQHNEEERSLHDMMIGQETRKPMRKIKIIAESDFDSDDSDWDYDEDDDDDYSDEDEEDEEEEEVYEGLQQKNLCPESERVGSEEFLGWKLEYDQYLLKTGLIKRIAQGDVRPTGKQQFLATLAARKDKGATPDDSLEFNEDLFGEDIEFDDVPVEEDQE